MQDRMHSLRSCLCGLVVWVAVAGLPAGAQAQTEPVRGWLHVIWDVAISPAHPDGRAFMLVEADGRSAEIDQAGMTPARRAELLGLDRSMVEAVAERMQLDASDRRPLLRVRSVHRTSPPPADLSASPAPGAAPPASPFITLLCRFADDPSTPFTRAQVATMMGNTYPGMAHFYAELAGGANVMANNHVTDWYVLPLPRSAYVEGATTRWGDVVRDCTAAADADVSFPDYAGINLQLNGNLSTRPTPPYDVLSFGGSWTLSLDGQTRSYGMTWMSGMHWNNYVVLSHEMGHALGWPHSSGRYGQEYDSRWDLMSAGYLHHVQGFGWLGIHTIASHKDHRGWIPADRRWTPAPATRTSGVISRTALPPANGFLMARIPLEGNEFYTVEARRVAGYDATLPGEAVVMHHVQGLRSFVVDPDNNGNPNDAGAMWVPGETFIDSIHGVSMRVDSATASGFGVTITRGWQLNVTVVGTGTVSGTPDGFSCTGECERLFGVRNTAVTLTATPGAGEQFLGWSGACTGSGTCSLTLGTHRSVRASFGQPLAITSDAARSAGMVGRPLADTLRVVGGTGTYVWAVSGGALPAGVTLAAQAGTLHGTPTAAGSYTFSLTASSEGATATREFTLQVYPALQVTADSLRRSAIQAQVYADTLRADGGTGTHTWAIASGALPAGVALDEQTGIIQGTPGESGTYHFVAVARSGGFQAGRPLALRVVGELRVLGDSARPAAAMGAAYADSLTVQGGDGAATWSVVHGTLVPGLTLAANGRISGVPEAAGAYHFTVAATDGRQTAERALVLTVAKPTLQPAAILDQLLGSGALTTDQVRFLDLLGNRNGRLDVGDVRAWLLDNQQLSGSAVEALRRTVDAAGGSS